MDLLNEELYGKDVYEHILAARVTYAQSKFKRSLYFFTFMLLLCALFCTSVAVIFVIHLWKVWV